jgi:hypothetical protein
MVNLYNIDTHELFYFTVSRKELEVGIKRTRSIKEVGFYEYVRIEYDLNQDGKTDIIIYHCIIERVLGESWVWQKEWFRKECDSNHDGRFDFYLEEDEQGAIHLYYYGISWENVEKMLVTLMPFLIMGYLITGSNSRESTE